MCLFARIRALLTLIVLASYSPAPDVGSGHLGLTLFIARRTRVAAIEQFEPTKAAVVNGTKLSASAPSTEPSAPCRPAGAES